MLKKRDASEMTVIAYACNCKCGCTGTDSMRQRGKELASKAANKVG